MASPTRRADLARSPLTGGIVRSRPGLDAVGLVRRDPVVAAGVAALALAIALAIALPPTLLSFLLGIVAVVGLARVPSLGVLPAGLLAVLAVPYGRAAENGLAEIAGIPVRFHDGAVIAAVLLALPAIRRIPLDRWIGRLLAAWLVLGLVALGIGFLGDNALRDIFRDVRWWSLYAVGLVALAVGAPRPAILRGLLIGVTIFALVLFVAALLPAFPSGLKARAMTYDWGLLRLQFSNSAFVVPAIAWVVDRLLHRATRRDVAWLALLAGAVVLSLTRMSIFAMLGVMGLTVLVALVVPSPGARLGRTLRGVALVAVALVAGAVVAFGTLAVGDPPPPAEPGEPVTGVNDPVDRIFFQDPNSDVDAIGRGRLVTYRAAVAEIDDAPILGGGLGQLVPIDFTFGGSEPATPGKQPGVDNAYLTAALKAGIIGAALLAAIAAWPLLANVRRLRGRIARWYLPAWLGVVGLTMTQSFATTGYGPFGFALLAVLLALPPSAALAARRARAE
jgi:O-Antigen ligase